MSNNGAQHGIYKMGGNVVNSRVVARFNFLCTLAENRLKSATFHTAKPLMQHAKTTDKKWDYLTKLKLRQTSSQE
ncbi:MAG: hypothetical protein CVU11_12505 [Bacteroidetes bacterium HGW-Bacteroidetes-6]|jgi:hypothetical protein|nr:MAG: hypothetical protein CVU11_12505 [Bacteroidetes bacterium HGW-Bacteroidetes-6]